MATWQTFESEAPELAQATRGLLEKTKHHVLATLRLDGSPRVSGTEVFWHAEHLGIGSMWGAVKARDLLRDPRYALHCNPGDGSMTGGDVKVSGTVVEIEGPTELVDPNSPAHFFALGLDEVVHVAVHPDGDRLVIQSWRPGAGVRAVERR